MRSPLLHWLPDSLSYRIVMARKCGFYDKQDTVMGAMEVIRDSHLLDIGQMKALFPDAVISKERFLGLVKSLTAIRH
jgi:predicted nuclease of restriction endonuclease-like RecB superfamily